MKWFSLSERNKERLINLIRFIVLIPMIFIGTLIYSHAHRIWIDYWVSKDGQRVSAQVTEAYSKHFFDYRYTVDGKEYAGNDYRDWEDEQIHKLQVGEQTTVFISASHPWLSSLRSIRLAWVAFPFITLLLLLEAFLLVVIFDPSGRWSVSRWFLYPQGGRRN